MFIVKSHGIVQKFDSKVEALCVAATLKAFGHIDVEVYKTVKITYRYL